LVAGLTQPAFAQQDNSGSSQMPTDQGASANTAAPTQLQPSEIQEQQIEGQQQPPAQPGG
jgi:hypothetical protein